MISSFCLLLGSFIKYVANDADVQEAREHTVNESSVYLTYLACKYLHRTWSVLQQFSQDGLISMHCLISLLTMGRWSDSIENSCLCTTLALHSQYKFKGFELNCHMNSKSLPEWTSYVIPRADCKCTNGQRWLCICARVWPQILKKQQISPGIHPVSDRWRQRAYLEPTPTCM